MTLADCESSVSLFLCSLKFVFCQLHDFVISPKSHALMWIPNQSVLGV